MAIDKSIEKAAMPLPAGEAEEAQAEFISAVAAGLGAEPHLSDGNCGSSFLADEKRQLVAKSDQLPFSYVAKPIFLC